MRNIIIFGAGKIGKKIYSLLKENNYKVYAFCDNSTDKIGKKIEDIKIISFEEMVELYKNAFDGVVIVATIYANEIVSQMRKAKLYMKTYGVNHIIQECITNKITISEILYEIDIDKPELEYLEVHVCDHCNLKCLGCGHFSNIAEEKYADLDLYKKDLLRLKELFWNIKRIRLLGGEPLLNKELDKFIIVTKKIFLGADVRVVTNGLLIPSIEDKILKIMRDCDVKFDISMYPPTMQKKDSIEKILNKNHVKYSFSKPIEKFYRNFNPEGNSDIELEFEECDSKTCHYLENGYIATCGRPFFAHKYGIGTEAKEMIENARVSIYDESLTGELLLKKFSQPMEMCRYCSFSTRVWFDWQMDTTTRDKKKNA